MSDSDEDKIHEETTTPEPEDVTKINDDVIGTIAGIELSKIKGVQPAGGGFTDFLGRKSPSKGIKVESSVDSVSIEAAIIVDYGTNIPEVAHEIQNRLRKSIGDMTGKYVKAVNITVQGIRTQTDKHPQPEKQNSRSESGTEEKMKEE